MSTPIVSVEHVRKRFAATQAVDDLSLEIARGEMFGLIGPDGAGKTTTIRLICGLLRPDAGTIRVLGHDPVAQHARVTEHVGYLSQRFSLYGDLSIDENIAFFAELHGVRDYASRRNRLLDMTQLTPELAEDLAHYQRVCFVDAHTGDLPADTRLVPALPSFTNSPFTHHLTPETCLALAQALYGRAPEAVVASVRGEQFGFAQTLSPATARRVPDLTRQILAWLTGAPAPAYPFAN